MFQRYLSRQKHSPFLLLYLPPSHAAGILHAVFDTYETRPSLTNTYVCTGFSNHTFNCCKTPCVGRNSVTRILTCNLHYCMKAGHDESESISDLAFFLGPTTLRLCTLCLRNLKVQSRRCAKVPWCDNSSAASNPLFDWHST